MVIDWKSVCNDREGAGTDRRKKIIGRKPFGHLSVEEKVIEKDRGDS